MAFQGDGALVDGDIPSAAILLVAKLKIETNRKIILEMYKGKKCPNLGSPLPEKAAFHRGIVDHVYGQQL